MSSTSSASSKMVLNPGPIILHSIAASLTAWGYYQVDQTAASEWISKQKGTKFQFLTVQGVIVAWLTMMFALGADLFPTSSILRRAKRGLFMLAFPLAVVISAIYWPLMIFYSELILPPSPGVTEPTSSSAVPKLMRLPLPADLALHAVPAISLIADFVWFEKKYSGNELNFGAPLITALAGLWYTNWVEYCASYNGQFPYPFLTSNPLEIRIVIYLVASTGALLSFWGLNALHP